MNYSFTPKLAALLSLTALLSFSTAAEARPPAGDALANSVIEASLGGRLVPQFQEDPQNTGLILCNRSFHPSIPSDRIHYRVRAFTNNFERFVSDRVLLDDGYGIDKLIGRAKQDCQREARILCTSPVYPQGPYPSHVDVEGNLFPLGPVRIRCEN